MWADNLPTWRDNTLKLQANARGVLTKQGVTFVDVPQAELDRVHADMVKQQDKAVADAHI